MKAAFITGANGGLGAGLARRYAADGWTVGLFARRAKELGDRQREIEAFGPRPSIYVGDVCDLQSVEAALLRFMERTGRLDLVIANAGRGESVSAERFDARSAQAVLSVNLVGLSNTLLSALSHMDSERGGTLVGMSSVAGYRAIPGSLAYSASKAGVRTFMEGLQLELAGTNLHAMSICPGFVRTPLTDQNDFPMPFLLECDDACARIQRAIEEKKRNYTFPFPMAVAAQLLRVAPHALLHAASPKSPLKR
jgi:hypothetical protein